MPQTGVVSLVHVVCRLDALLCPISHKLLRKVSYHVQYEQTALFEVKLVYLYVCFHLKGKGALIKNIKKKSS